MDDRYPTSGAPSDAGGGKPLSPPRAPTWVKVLGIVAAVVALVFLLLLLTGGDHGPGRHVGGEQERPPGVDHTAEHR